MALSENTGTLLPLMDLLEEGQVHGIYQYTYIALLTQYAAKYSKIMAGALELANVPKMRPRATLIKNTYTRSTS
jgi:hypothetical protein